MRYYLGLLTTLIATALAASRTTAPAGALVVGKGSGAKYKTIQSAVNALSTTSTKAQSIFIGAGTYAEQVYVPLLSGPLTIYGYTTDDTSYDNNVVVITASGSQETKPSNDETATLRVWTSNFKLYNVNVINSFGKGSQALALSANAAGQGYYGCSFEGYQDTVESEKGAQLFAKSYISGNTDFIFGRTGLAWFSACDIRVVAGTLGYVTASGIQTAGSKSIFVIDHSTVAAKTGDSVPNGAYYLGRPWGAYAHVVFQSTTMSAVINPAGWSQWNVGDARTATANFGEYANSGAGSQGTRASFSHKLSAPVAIGDVLGSGYKTATWVDTTYLA